MPRKKKVEEVVKEAAISPAHMKLVGMAQSKRAPLLSKEKGELLYSLLQEAGAKIRLEQPMFMPQYADGKEPLGKFMIYTEFRVVIDLTE